MNKKRIVLLSIAVIYTIVAILARPAYAKTKLAVDSIDVTQTSITVTFNKGLKSSKKEVQFVVTLNGQKHKLNAYPVDSGKKSAVWRVDSEPVCGQLIVKKIKVSKKSGGWKKFKINQEHNFDCQPEPTPEPEPTLTFAIDEFSCDSQIVRFDGEHYFDNVVFVIDGVENQAMVGEVLDGFSFYGTSIDFWQFGNGAHTFDAMIIDGESFAVGQEYYLECGL